ncbi:MAG: hypothetical protein PVF43_13990 [Candidatus Eiseniibacteriota bacterium]|jgi:hypothetical protein
MRRAVIRSVIAVALPIAALLAWTPLASVAPAALDWAIPAALAQSGGTVEAPDDAAASAARPSTAPEPSAPVATTDSTRLTPTITGARCLVCGQPIGADDITLFYRGRHISMHEGHCRELWSEDCVKYFRPLEARGALFQERATGIRLTSAWFFIGGYIVIGLVFGAICGFAAIGRGLPPLRWFLFGLLANVIGLVALLVRGRGDVSALPQGVPTGMRKVATTRAPVPCPHCGACNHPAADRCAACGEALEPGAVAETRATGTTGKTGRSGPTGAGPAQEGDGDR